MYKVLLVDDEYMIPLGLKKMIDWNALGFEVVATADSANDALSILEEQPVDLIITDVTMPEINGLEFIEAAQKQQHEFEFVILSGYQEFSYLKSGLQLGAVNYLMKPVNKEELIDTLKKVKERIKQQVDQKNQQEVYQENVLIQWLNDELEEKEEEEVLTWLKPDNRWTPVVVQIQRHAARPFDQWLKGRQEYVYIHQNIGNDALFTILDKENDQQDIFDYLTENFSEDKWWISVGEPGVMTEEVPVSYQDAKNRLQVHQFYNHKNKIIFSEKNAKQEQEMGFSELNRFLRNNQLNESEALIKEIFQKIKLSEMPPEKVRQAVLLLFMNIRSELFSFEDEKYLEVIQKINQAHHIDELEMLLIDTLKKEKQQLAYSENVSQVIQIIKDSYQEELTLKSVANQLYLNAMYLGQLFKKEVKMSFSQYLNQFRIEKAKQLLVVPKYNINEISLMIGFNNTTYFSKKFKKIVGMTPKEFREMHLHQTDRNE